MKSRTVAAVEIFLRSKKVGYRFESEDLKQNDRDGFTRKNPAKKLAAIAKLAFDIIPQNATRLEYRQGNTLGEGHKHWFLAKFFQQYRLSFRYHARGKVIVYAWVNDEETKRAYESGDDAHRIFRKMLESGHPPDDGDGLLSEARTESSRIRPIAAKAGALGSAHETK